MQKGSLKQIKTLKQKGSLKTALKVEKKTNITLLQTTEAKMVYQGKKVYRSKKVERPTSKHKAPTPLKR